VSTIDTEHFQKRLEDEKARLEHALGFLARDNAGSLADELGEVNDSSVDNHLGDVASATFDRELEDGLGEGAKQMLDDVNAALQRIADGTFGTCEVCGKPIGDARLEAIPWTRLCIDDQRRAG
jgi:RNA polymerase-binding protein DksA